MYKGKTYMVVSNSRLDKQSFSGLRITPWESKRIKIIIFDSGKVNCTGIKNDEEKFAVIEFMRTVLFPIMRECTVTDDELNFNLPTCLGR